MSFEPVPSSQTFPLAGAATGDSVAPGLAEHNRRGLQGQMWVSAPNTVSLRMAQLLGGGTHAGWQYLPRHGGKGLVPRIQPGSTCRTRSRATSSSCRDLRWNTCKNGTSWLLQRGYGFMTPMTPSTPVTLRVICSPRRFDYGASGSSWLWAFQNDPHGQNTSGTTIRIAPDYTHPVPRPTVTVSDVGRVDVSPSVYGYAITDGSGYMPANNICSLVRHLQEATELRRSSSHRKTTRSTRKTQRRQPSRSGFWMLARCLGQVHS
jgi:hypothetical protein